MMKESESSGYVGPVGENGITTDIFTNIALRLTRLETQNKELVVRINELEAEVDSLDEEIDYVHHLTREISNGKVSK